MPTLPTSCRALAWRSSSASAGDMPTCERESLAEAPDALDVQPGLGVAPLHRHAEPLDDLDLGLPQLLRALAHAPLEAPRCRARRLPRPALGQLAPGDRADAADDQGGERPDDVERSARRRTRAGRRPGRDRPRRGRRARRPARGSARRPWAPPARAARPAADRASVGAFAQRRAVQRGPDRVRLDLGARHRLVAPDGRGVHVAQRGRGGADDDYAVAECAGREAALDHVGERDGADACRAGRGSRSRRRRRRTLPRAAAVGRRDVPSPRRSCLALRRCGGSARLRPASSLCRSDAAASAWTRRRLASPPRTSCGRARRSRWWRARRRRRRRSRVQRQVLAGVVGSVNWTS